MEGQRAQSVAGPVVRMFGGSGGRAAGRMRQRQARTLQELGQRRLLSAEREFTSTRVISVGP